MGPLETRRHVQFTPEEFYRLDEQAMLPKFSELVDGEIIEMPDRWMPEVHAVQTIAASLGELWHDSSLVCRSLTYAFASGWHPMPDVTVFDRRPPRHPREGPYPEPRLIVEVADQDLDYDLGEKAGRYAVEGVVDYWVADVNDRVLHVFREPDAGGFRSRDQVEPGDRVSPLCLPGSSLAVADLLPGLKSKP